MNDSSLRWLPEDMRRQLATCGITTETQLAACSVASLQRDLRQASEFFPNETYNLTADELAEVINRAQRHTKIALPASAPNPARKHSLIQVQDMQFRTTPDYKEQERKKGRRKFAISSGHPFLLLFGAASALLVPLAIASVIFIPYMLLATDYRPLGKEVTFYILIPFVMLIPHLMTVFLTHCSVCHMRIFSYRKYPHHSNAHHIPLLGVVPATALRILFTFHFTCPACGTAQKLFGKKSKSHRH